MVDPWNVTNYNRTDEELEEFLLFCIAVAGKTAKQISSALENFIFCGKIEYGSSFSPFQIIRQKYKDNTLLDAVKESKLGKHSLLTESFGILAFANLNLKTCSIQELEAIPGIGPKTSRFFLVHSRKDANYAILDTHILRYMREKLSISTPKNTPTKKKYQELERRFLDFVKQHPSKKSIAELDLKIWSLYART